MKITRHTELQVFQRSFELAMVIFELSKRFPKEEVYSLTDQLRRASRSVAANITEAWRKRRYQGMWISKLSDAEGEAAETQTWLQFAHRCGYLPIEDFETLNQQYDEIIAMLVSMANHPEKWIL